MKILSKEEEQAHTRTVWTGGILGSLGGAGLGAVGVWAAGLRYPAFRQLSLPFRSYLIVASTAFGGVVTADRYSHAFERSRHADSDYQNRTERELQSAEQQEGLWTRTKNFISEHRYPIVYGSWVASMAIALGIVGRQKELTAQQKLVQARVYAQGLTLAVLLASFGLEGNDLRAGKGRWETIKVLDPNDPEHKRLIEKKIHHESYSGEDQWMDMIESQEQRMKSKGHRVHDRKGKDKQQSSKNGDEKGEEKKEGESENPEQESQSSKKGNSKAKA